ncbi:hypothetical protein ACQY0O_001136 [Thecaphora frezii]
MANRRHSPLSARQRDSWSTLASPLDHLKHPSFTPPHRQASPKTILHQPAEPNPIRWSTCTLANDLPDHLDFNLPQLRNHRRPQDTADTSPAPLHRRSRKSHDSCIVHHDDSDQDGDDEVDDARSCSPASTRPTSFEADPKARAAAAAVAAFGLASPRRTPSCAPSRPPSYRSPTPDHADSLALREALQTQAQTQRLPLDPDQGLDSDGQPESDAELNALVARTMQALVLSNDLLVSTLASRASFAQLRALESNIQCDMDRREQDVRRQLHAVEQMSDLVAAKANELQSLLASGSATRPYALARTRTAGAGTSALDSLPSIETLAVGTSTQGRGPVGIGIVEAQDRDATIGKTAAKRLEKMLLESAKPAFSNAIGGSLGRTRAASAQGVLARDGYAAGHASASASTTRRTLSLSSFPFLDANAFKLPSPKRPSSLAEQERTGASPLSPATSRPALAVRKRSSRGSSLASIIENTGASDSRPARPLLGARASGTFSQRSSLTSSSSTSTIRATARQPSVASRQPRAVSHYEPLSSRNLTLSGSKFGTFAATTAASALSLLMAAPITSTTTQLVQQDAFADAGTRPSLKLRQSPTAGLPDSSSLESETTYAALLSATLASTWTPPSPYLGNEDSALASESSDDHVDASGGEAGPTLRRTRSSARRRYSMSKRSSFGASSDRERQSIATQLKAEEVLWRAQCDSRSSSGEGGALKALQRLNEMSAAGHGGGEASALAGAPNGPSQATSKRLSMGLGLPSFTGFRAPASNDDGDNAQNVAATATESRSRSTSVEAGGDQGEASGITLSGWRGWTPWASPVLPSSTSAGNLTDEAAQKRGKTGRKPSLPSLLATKATPSTATMLGV